MVYKYINFNLICVPLYFLSKTVIFINMKKLLSIILIFLLTAPCVFSEDDFFDNYTGIDRAWDGQKPVTNQEFENAIDVLQSKQKKKEARKKKRKIRRISGGGTSLHNALDPASEIQAQAPLTNKEEGVLLNLTVDIIVDGKILEKGYYNIFGEKDKADNIYISLYQSQFLKGKVKAKETQNDYESEDINFVKIIPYDETYIKIVFGCLDFNAYTFVRYVNIQ